MLGRRALGLALARAALLAGVGDLLTRPKSARAAAALAPLRARLDGAAGALRRGAIHQRAWQAEVAALLADVDPGEVIAALALGPALAALNAAAERPRVIPLGDDDGDGERGPTLTGVRHRIFTFTRGQAIVPHGHDNLVSAFVAVRGTIRARHFERLADAADHVVIRPTIDRVLGPGEHTSISDFHDNVHWLAAEEGEALVYNVSVDAGAGARRPGRRAGRVYLDPDGRRLADGSIAAPRASRRALEVKYDRGR